MSAEVIVAFISLVGTAIGSIGGILLSNKLTNYRIAQLEKKVDKHNTIVERTYILEEKIKFTEEKLNDLEREIKN